MRRRPRPLGVRTGCFDSIKVESQFDVPDPQANVIIFCPGGSTITSRVQISELSVGHGHFLK